MMLPLRPHCLLIAVLLIAASCTYYVVPVKHADFRTCAQTGFCRRARARAQEFTADAALKSPFRLDRRASPSTQDADSAAVVTVRGSYLHADIVDGRDSGRLHLDISLLRDGVARIRVNEDPTTTIHPRYDGVKDIVLVDSTPPATDPANVVVVHGKATDAGAKEMTVSWDNSSLRIIYEPFSMDFSHDGEHIMSVNGLGFMEFERSRVRETIPDDADDEVREAREARDTSESDLGMWGETFNNFYDTKPHGPMSFSVDITFEDAEMAYGLPEHATPFSLRTTHGPNHSDPKAYSDPYRLYNLDVFEYEADSSMAIYGGIPILHALRTNGKIGSVFWMNPSETWVDLDKKKKASGWNVYNYGTDRNRIDSHWMSETGVMDFFLFPGPDFASVLDSYTALTGRPAMPPLFATAYHQCRWNYNDEEDVKSVDATFDKHGIPYDVIWLDIEHTDGKRYFTWDESKFPDPKAMQLALGDKGRKLVTIVDPHIKKDDNYDVYKEACDRGLYVKNAAGDADYEGWCWPGNSAYLDFMNSDAEEYIIGRYKLDVHPHATEHLYIWNDMNEPSVFSGPEITMPKDLKHFGGLEHREIHNLYGLLYHKSTSLALTKRMDPPRRPSVLSRALFSGTQRWGAVWTGDNFATWEHLALSIPMLSTLSVAGVPFSGADVGGFFGNPDAELITRWYQAGALQPFFRAHAHLDAKRREPWLFGAKYTAIIRNAIRLRYRLLPYIYTQFHFAHLTGMPVMRPMVMLNSTAPFSRDDQTQFLLGPAVLVRPITEPGATTALVRLYGEEVYYDFFNYARVQPGDVNVKVSLARIPVYARGGSIIPMKDRPRRSSAAMRGDPYTLYVYLSADMTASGQLYLDDGMTYAHEQGAFIHKQYDFRKNKEHEPHAYCFKSTDYFQQLKTVSDATLEREKFLGSNGEERVEKIVIIGLERMLGRAKLVMDGGKTERELDVEWDKNAKLAIVRDPKAPISGNWEVLFD